MSITTIDCDTAILGAYGYCARLALTVRPGIATLAATEVHQSARSSATTRMPEMDRSNTPSFLDYVESAIGSRDWYTRPRPCPVKARNRHYISPALWRDLKGAYEQTFGREAW